MSEQQRSAIDWSAALESVNGDQGLLLEVVQILADDLPNLREEVREAIENQDVEALRQAAHKMKGSVRFLGPSTVYDVAFQLEQRGMNGDLDGVSQLQSELVKELESMSGDLTRFCQTAQTDRP
jgi:two-component system sensor histidine kinase BarA